MQAYGDVLADIEICEPDTVLPTDERKDVYIKDVTHIDFASKDVTFTMHSRELNSDIKVRFYDGGASSYIILQSGQFAEDDDILAGAWLVLSVGSVVLPEHQWMHLIDGDNLAFLEELYQQKGIAMTNTAEIRESFDDADWEVFQDIRQIYHLWKVSFQ